MEKQITRAIATAQQFGDCLRLGDYDTAHSLLTGKLQQDYSKSGLQQAVEEMISYGSGPIDSVEVLTDYLLTDWPGMMPEDVAWLYVSLAGGDFLEAVSVVVTKCDSRLTIRDIEWGRP